jgi:hypothetical protein
MSYVKAAKELPYLTQEEVEAYALRYGLVDTASQGAGGKEEDKSSEKGSSSEKRSSNEKEIGQETEK